MLATANAVDAMMRVIAGEARGSHLKTPKGVSTRPTSDLVRGAIFNTLGSLAVDRSRVLDLYAGSGALGIEALSRGAGWADFVEHDERCCVIIKENLDHTGLAGRAHVYCLKVPKALSILSSRYGLVLLDPPYEDLSLLPTLERLTSSALVGPGSTLVIEHSRRTPLPENLGDFAPVKEIRHGDTCVSVYQSKSRRLES